mmetsp:Transcript_4815/g.14332  ORF Transcript_4815/g.14332 Transcript_4815/m.14332 type:complete len:201 (-) Transcript_4815:177-779(-)
MACVGRMRCSVCTSSLFEARQEHRLPVSPHGLRDELEWQEVKRNEVSKTRVGSSFKELDFVCSNRVDEELCGSPDHGCDGACRKGNSSCKTLRVVIAEDGAYAADETKVEWRAGGCVEDESELISGCTPRGIAEGELDEVDDHSNSLSSAESLRVMPRAVEDGDRTAIPSPAVNEEELAGRELAPQPVIQLHGKLLAPPR